MLTFRNISPSIFFFFFSSWSYLLNVSPSPTSQRLLEMTQPCTGQTRAGLQLGSGGCCWLRLDPGTPSEQKLLLQARKGLPGPVERQRALAPSSGTLNAAVSPPACLQAGGTLGHPPAAPPKATHSRCFQRGGVWNERHHLPSLMDKSIMFLLEF